MNTINGDGWRLKYKFEIQEVRLYKPVKIKQRYPHNVYVTDCAVSLDDGKTWTWGRAMNSPHDQFVRKIGMVLSFSRALKLSVSDKKLRKEIFRKFWEKHGKRLYSNKVARVA